MFISAGHIEYNMIIIDYVILFRIPIPWHQQHCAIAAATLSLSTHTHIYTYEFVYVKTICITNYIYAWMYDRIFCFVLTLTDL